MKKDIPILKVQDIAVVIAPENEDIESEIWDVYILNFKDEAIENVLINSRGYGEIGGEQVKTTVLRYFYEKISAQSFVKLELIKREVFQLANEYWVSFNLNNHMYDKRYIFVNGSIEPSNFTHVPLLNRKGVMIR